MAARVVLFPKMDVTAGQESLDPNLARLFTGDELFEVWDELELAAINRVRDLLKNGRRNPEIELAEAASERFIAQIAALLLRRAAERALLRPPSMSLTAKPRR